MGHLHFPIQLHFSKHQCIKEPEEPPANSFQNVFCGPLLLYCLNLHFNPYPASKDLKVCLALEKLCLYMYDRVYNTQEHIKWSGKGRCFSSKLSVYLLAPSFVPCPPTLCCSAGNHIYKSSLPKGRAAQTGGQQEGRIRYVLTSL